MSDCPHCGLTATEGHDCPESRPKEDLVERLREDHRDTIECEHGFTLHRDACPNVVCLARDLAAAADEIERLRGLAGIESNREAAHRAKGAGLTDWRGIRWIASGARKPTTCWFSGKPIAVGDPVYRPLGNGAHRMMRVLASEWDGVI